MDIKFPLFQVSCTPDEIVVLSNYLGGRIAYLVDFTVDCARTLMKEGECIDAVEEVGALRRKLARMKVPRKPQLLTVTGTFYPGLLLSSGWWEHTRRASLPKVDWQDPLQDWLFRGFQEWGPSWDINSAAQTTEGDWLLAQLGNGDEVNSLPLIISHGQAATLRDELREQPASVFSANVTGMLCHRQHLPEPVLNDIGSWGRAFDYCLVVDDDERLSVSHRAGRPELYSGYLWQCWGRDVAAQEQMPQLANCYFVWEHTDFTRPEALRYNLDMLQNKVDYIQKQRGDLVLLQKSCALIPGEPSLATEHFRNFVLGGTELHWTQ